MEQAKTGKKLLPSTRQIISRALEVLPFAPATVDSMDMPLFEGEPDLKSRNEAKMLFFGRANLYITQMVVSVLNTKALREFVYAKDELEKDKETPLVTEPYGGNDYYTFSMKPRDFFTIALGKDCSSQTKRNLKMIVEQVFLYTPPPMAMPNERGSYTGKIKYAIPFIVSLDINKEPYSMKRVEGYIKSLAKKNKTKIVSEREARDFIWTKITQIKIQVHKNLVLYGEAAIAETQAQTTTSRNPRKKGKGYYFPIPSNYLQSEIKFLADFHEEQKQELEEYVDDLEKYTKAEGKDFSKEFDDMRQGLKNWYRTFKLKVYPLQLEYIDRMRAYLNIHDTHTEKTSLKLDFEEFVHYVFFGYSMKTKGGMSSHRKNDEIRIFHSLLLFVLEELTNAKKGLRNGTKRIPCKFSIKRGGQYNTVKEITFDFIRPDDKLNFVYLTEREKDLEENKIRQKQIEQSLDLFITDIYEYDPQKIQNKDTLEIAKTIIAIDIYTIADEFKPQVRDKQKLYDYFRSRAGQRTTVEKIADDNDLDPELDEQFIKETVDEYNRNAT